MLSASISGDSLRWLKATFRCFTLYIFLSFCTFFSLWKGRLKDEPYIVSGEASCCVTAEAMCVFQQLQAGMSGPNRFGEDSIVMP